MHGLWDHGMAGAIGRGEAEMKKRFPFLAALDATRAIGPACSAQGEPCGSDSASLLEGRSLWVDGVGGFRLIDRDEVILGQASAGGRSDIRIVGDLRREAAAIRRCHGDYLIQPLQDTRLDGAPIDRPCLLPRRAELMLGERVRIAFSVPNLLSATARLELKSVHRYHPRVAESHVVCRNWSREIVLFRKASGYYLRADEGVWINGSAATGVVPLVQPTRVEGEDFSFSFE